MTHDHVNAIRNQNVMPIWNSRRCEFSHVNTPLHQDISRFLSLWVLLNLLTKPFSLLKKQGNWVETFAKTSGTDTRDGKNWPIADRRVPSNNPRINCGKQFGSSPFLVSKAANGVAIQMTVLWQNFALVLLINKHFYLLATISSEKS